MFKKISLKYVGRVLTKFYSLQKILSVCSTVQYMEELCKYIYLSSTYRLLITTIILRFIESKSSKEVKGGKQKSLINYNDPLKPSNFLVISISCVTSRLDGQKKPPSYGC